jgi:hypothetical protein
MHEQLVVIPLEQVKIGANVELGPNDFDQGDFARKGESQEFNLLLDLKLDLQHLFGGVVLFLVEGIHGVFLIS